jgi:outer membrane autotransporter protein
MDNSRSRLRLLLATSSLAALIVGACGPARAGGGCGIGTTSGYNNPFGTTVPCIFFNGLNVTGNAVNAGTVSPGGPFGIKVLGGTFNGAVINSGSITIPGGVGISINTVTNFTGGVTNSGTISANATGISVSAVSTFAGGITNTGTITSVGNFGISVSAGGFSGGVVNNGTISTQETAILVSATAFSGGITNHGTITANFSNGITVSGGGVFAGGITNTGKISATDVAISVSKFTSFTGGISNSGTISASSRTGIGVASVQVFTGGITNSGTISAGSTGIGVSGVPTFSAGISNSGMITAGSTGISVMHVSVFSGGISNSGTISAQSTGIFVNFVSTFTGGINNSGSILTPNQPGIWVANVLSFSDGISNSGMIASLNEEGIHVGIVSNFSGGIRNSGTIAVPTETGIFVGSVSTFTGGITNSGTITAFTGIRVFAGVTFSGAIVNSGNITSTSNGGAAIDVSSAPNAMTINQMAGTITGAIKLSHFADNLNISGGTINGNIVGAGTTNTVNFALGAGTFTYGSAFSITGVNLINVNSGLVILNGSNSATNVAVNGGTLEVGDASNLGAILTATGGLTIGVGGTLAGHGTVVGNITIPSGATLAPGGSIGTLNVTGNLSLAANSFYSVEVNAAAQNSKTVATGTATIAGGTVQVIEDLGVYAPPLHYTILTANGGVTGTFAGAVSQFAFLTPTLTYDANDVFLTLSRNASGFAGAGRTSNQRGVGAALDASALGSALVQTMTFQTAAGAQQALNALSGEIDADLQSALLDDSHYMRDAVLGRLRQATYTGAPGTMGALGFAGPVAVAAEDESPGLAYAGLPVKTLAKAPPAALRPYPSDLTFWSQGVGAWGHIDGDGNASATRRDLGGFFSGIDARFGDLARIGLVGGYTHSSVSVDAAASSAGIDTAHLGAYAGANFGPLNLRGGAALAFHTIDTTRTIAFPGFFDRANAHYSGTTGQIFGEAAYGVTFGAIAAEPFAGLAFAHLHTDGFAENGGIAALNGSGDTEGVGYSSLGIRAAKSFMLANGMALVPRASAAWQHAFGDVTPAAGLAFQSLGASFATSGVPLARDAALVEAGLDLRVSPRAKLGASYSGELANHLQDNAVKGNFSWNF